MGETTHFRGPVSLDQVELAIGASYDFALVASIPRSREAWALNRRLGYTWKCGCEARGNGVPFCLWRPCPEHAPLASGLKVTPVPEMFEGGVPVPAEDIPPARPGDVVRSAAPEIAKTLKAGSPVAYVENGSLMLEYPDGRREVLERR